MLWPTLRVAISESGAQVRCGPLPVLDGSSTRLFQLFQNLLSNAMKFSDGGPTKVYLGVEEKEDEWWVSVRDEGIGIAPEATERIFVMFQRLHTGPANAVECHIFQQRVLLLDQKRETG